MEKEKGVAKRKEKRKVSREGENVLLFLTFFFLPILLFRGLKFCGVWWYTILGAEALRSKLEANLSYSAIPCVSSKKMFPFLIYGLKAT